MMRLGGVEICQLSPCHCERSDESEVCEWRMCNEFRFFTPLRCVQNDRVKALRSE